MRLKNNSEALKTDRHGYLKNHADWNFDVANLIASQLKIEMTDEHWAVVTTLREFYLQHGVLPPMRGLIRLLQEKIPPEKNTSIYLQRLFPEGLMKQASKIAGLPKPVRCI